MKAELLAGFACGWALASEYSAGLVIVGLALYYPVLIAGGTWHRRGRGQGRRERA